MVTTTPDAAVATAINSVLEAEREVAAAVAAAQAAAQATIDAAREDRRRILDRARQRVGRVRDIAQGQLARRLAELDATVGKSLPGDVVLETAVSTAIERLAVQLTTDQLPAGTTR